MLLGRCQVFICPDERGVVVVEVPQKLDGDGAGLRGFVTPEDLGVDLPEEAEDGPLVVEGDRLGEAVVELEEEQDLGLGDLVRVRVDKQVVKADVVELLEALVGQVVAHVADGQFAAGEAVRGELVGEDVHDLVLKERTKTKMPVPDFTRRRIFAKYYKYFPQRGLNSQIWQILRLFGIFSNPCVRRLRLHKHIK